jgi:hypothetical protein
MKGVLKDGTARLIRDGQVIRRDNKFGFPEGEFELAERGDQRTFAAFP